MTTTHQDPRPLPQAALNRRTLMVGAAGLTFGIALGLDEIAALAAPGKETVFNAWVTIAK